MRKLMWFALGFGAACCLCAYLHAGWAAALLCLLASVGLLVGMRYWKPLRIGAAVAVGLTAGFLWFSLYNGVYWQDARNYDDQTVDATITARDYPYDTSYGCAFDGEIELEGKTYRVRTYLNDAESLIPGDTVTGLFRLRFTIGEEDQYSSFQGKGIFLLAYQAEDDYAVTYTDTHSLKDMPAVWRSKLIGILDSALPAKEAGFAKALLLGQKWDIDYKTKTDFQVSGISHIIAVSGLHISILFALVYQLTGKRRLLTVLVGIPILLGFAAIAGFTPSVVRAAIMQGLMMLALLLDKEYDSPTALAFAAFTLLVCNPMVITSVSFQLSVGCVAGIILFSQPLREWIMDKKRLGRRNNRITRWFAGSVSVTVGAAVFTTPLVAVYFGTVSLVSLLTNLMVLWVVTGVFYGLIAVCVLGLVHGTLSSILGAVLVWPIRYIMGVASLLAKLPFAAVYTVSIYTVIWLVFCYCLIVLFLLMKKKRPLLLCCTAVLALCVSIGLSWLEPQLDDTRMTVLDVGQGQAVLLQTQGKTFLVDCGGSNDSQAADITAQTLLSQGIRTLDGIIVTHYDRDHAGALDELLTRIDTKSLILPFTQDNTEISQTLQQMLPDRTVFVSEDMQLTLERGALTIFAPASYVSGNESSMGILLNSENCAILITGDRNRETEGLLMDHYDLPHLDVLVVGHHGSKTSTGEALLLKTTPEYAVISVGKDNPYGHPSREVLERLHKYNCTVLRTDLYGTIIFRR